MLAMRRSILSLIFVTGVMLVSLPGRGADVQREASPAPSPTPAGLTSLAWQPLAQSGAGGPVFPEHFSAAVPGGFVIASILVRGHGAGAGLVFVRQLPSKLTWHALEQSGASGPTFPVLFRANVAGGTLVLALLARDDDDGVGLTFVPGYVGAVKWEPLEQSGAGGPAFPGHFRAGVAGGTLIASVLNRAHGAGAGLAFVPGTAVTQLTWQSLSQSGGGGSAFPVHFAAPAGGGSLVVGVLNRADGDATGLIYTPQPVTALNWQGVGQTGAGGPVFPFHVSTHAAGGTLLASVLVRDDGDGADLTFIP